MLNPTTGLPLTDEEVQEMDLFLDFLFSEPEPVRPSPTHCEHGISFLGYEVEGQMTWDTCQPCDEARWEEESKYTYKDFPDDSRFFDEEAQRDLELHIFLGGNR